MRKKNILFCFRILASLIIILLSISCNAVESLLHKSKRVLQPLTLRLQVGNYYKDNLSKSFSTYISSQHKGKSITKSMTKNSIIPRSKNFSEWYHSVIKEANLAENSPVRGCMIIKPLGVGIWELIQKNLDYMIKETGHQNVYFPMLIPLSFFQKEAEHIDGFAKECAVVTHYRLTKNKDGKLIPSPDAELEPMIIRPTSETMIGEAMSRWVKSYRDLPVKINQWCNVMRWELRPRIFLRTSEFLWQEGHTAHSSQNEALVETLTMLDTYETFVQNYLAIPVIKGKKTQGEKFPGAVDTFTIETMMQDGKAVQAGTSHFLGQSFSKAYNIEFLDQYQNKQIAWTTSWGVSTRLIGAIIMSHSDDNGLVLPPRIAPEQIRIIPVINNEVDSEGILTLCDTISNSLKNLKCFGENIRVQVDKSHDKPAEKFWNAVIQGVPLRIEIGKREVASNYVTISQRNFEVKNRKSVKIDDFIKNTPSLLEDIQLSLFEKASLRMKNNIHTITSIPQMKSLFSDKNGEINKFAIGFFDVSYESNSMFIDLLKELKVTPRCIPFNDQEDEGKCIFSGNITKTKVIFGVSY